MAVVRWEPLRELTGLQSDMNRLFDSFFSTGGTPGTGGNVGNATRGWIPAMDLVEGDQHFVLRADLPGLDEEDISIEVEDGVLTISGERKVTHETKEGGVHRLERATGRFSRSLSLREGIDPAAVEANFDRGVLEVRIPKPEEPKSRRVEIRVGERPGIEAGAAQ